MGKFKVFISSSQKEFKTERIAVQEVILETEILNRYFEIEMWEEFPAMGFSPRQAYLEKLKECEIYIGIFGKEYSEPTVDEYHAAKNYGKYILIFLKGKNDMERDTRLRELLKDLRGHKGYTYKRFEDDYRELKRRVEIASPGLLPQPLTIDMIRSLHYRPVSRNPIIARTMYEMGLMEERGGGIRRMHDLMINHGLKPPEFSYDSGYFIVTFYSPMEKILELHPPKARVIYSIENARIANLNDTDAEGVVYYAVYLEVQEFQCLRLLPLNQSMNQVQDKVQGRNDTESRGVIARSVVSRSPNPESSSGEGDEAI